MSKKKIDQSYDRAVLRPGQTAKLKVADLETTELDGEPVVKVDFISEDESTFSVTFKSLEYSTEERESDGEIRVVYRLVSPTPKHGTTFEFPPLPKRPRNKIFLNLDEGLMGYGMIIKQSKKLLWESHHPRLPSDVGGDELTDEYLSLLLRLVDELGQSFSGVKKHFQQRGRAKEKAPGPGSAEAVEGETAGALINALAAIRTANLLDDATDFLVGHAFGYLLHSSLVARNEARRKYAKAFRARRGAGTQADERRQWIKHELFDLIEKKSTAGRSCREIKSLVRQKYAKEFDKSDNTFRSAWKAIDADLLVATAV